MNETVKQETVDAIRLDAETAKAINRLMLDAWPHIAQQKEGTTDFLMQRWMSYKGSHLQRPLYHLAYRAGDLAALAHTFARTIASPEGSMTVMGLANVCVIKSEQGQGLGRQVVKAAFTRIERGDFKFCLFQTSSKVELFYTRLGAVTVGNRFYNSFSEDPMANPFWESVPMRYPAVCPWPASDIDLRGPGF